MLRAIRNWFASRRGFSIPLALVGGGVLALVVSALSIFSQSELKIVKSLLGRTTSEYAAYSGIMWSYERLCREGRWYQPGTNSLTDRGLKWVNGTWTVPITTPVPFTTPDGVKVTVYLDEAASTKTWSPRGKTVNGGKGFQMLDHIKVLALGESGGEASLIFAKYIMMPEPLLNSNSTKGAIDEDPAEENEGEYVLRVSPINKKKTGYGATPTPGYIESSDIDLTGRIKIKSIPVQINQKVRMEDYSITFNTEWIDSSGTGWASQEPKMRARYDGVVKEILVKEGQILKEGDPLMIIKKDIQQKSTQFPLQKMVRITKIPLNIFGSSKLETIKERLKNVKDRWIVYEYVGKLRDEYLRNYDTMCRTGADSQVESFLNTINSPAPKETLKESEMNLPAVQPGDTEDGNAQFVENLLHNFIPPLGMDNKTAKAFAGSATFRLGVEKREITPQLRELLEIHGLKLHGDKNYYTNQLETLPKKMLKQGIDLYNIKSDKPDGAVGDFLKAMKEYGAKDKNEKSKATDKFINSMTALGNAAVKANIYLNESTPWTPEAFAEKLQSGEIKDPENYFRWKNSKGEEGFWKYAPEKAISVDPVDVPYYYENASPITKEPPNPLDDPNYTRDKSHFRMRVDYVMKFFKKHYDDGSPPTSFETLRPDDDVEDTPQGPPLPDATGCSFSGVSS